MYQMYHFPPCSLMNFQKGKVCPISVETALTSSISRYWGPQCCQYQSLSWQKVRNRHTVTSVCSLKSYTVQKKIPHKSLQSIHIKIHDNALRFIFLRGTGICHMHHCNKLSVVFLQAAKDFEDKLVGKFNAQLVMVWFCLTCIIKSYLDLCLVRECFTRFHEIRCTWQQKRCQLYVVDTLEISYPNVKCHVLFQCWAFPPPITTLKEWGFGLFDQTWGTQQPSQTFYLTRLGDFFI